LAKANSSASASPVTTPGLILWLMVFLFYAKPYVGFRSFILVIV